MIYHVFANRSNIGDWLSARGIQKLLSPLKVKECLCDDPFVLETIACLSKANKRDLIIIGGGGLLMDYFDRFWQGFSKIAMSVPFCVWGVGYCDLKYEKTHPHKGLIEDIINQSKLCIVRDELTRSYLKNCNLSKPVLCPSIVVIEKSEEKGEGLLHVDNYTTVGSEAYEAMCAAGKTFAKEIEGVYRKTNNRIQESNENQLNTALNYYRNSRYILSSGLHGCVIGAAMGKKILAVSGDRKIDMFMESVGLKKWTLDPKEIDHIDVKLHELHKQISTDLIIEKFRIENKNIARNIFHIIKENLIEVN